MHLNWQFLHNLLISVNIIWKKKSRIEAHRPKSWVKLSSREEKWDEAGKVTWNSQCKKESEICLWNGALVWLKSCTADRFLENVKAFPKQKNLADFRSIDQMNSHYTRLL